MFDEDNPDAQIDGQKYLKDAKKHILNEELIGTIKMQKLEMKEISRLYDQVQN